MNEHRGLSMRTQRGVVSFIALLCVLTAIDAPAQQKLAQTGMKFLNVLPDARAAALGEAMTSLEGPASSLFFNTASMGRMTGLSSMFVSHTQWIADIKHMYAAAAFSPFDGEYGVIGFNFQAVDYGVFEETILWNNDAGYLDLGTFKPSAIMVGIGYARALNDKFSVGGNVKYVRQSLGDGTNALAANGDPVKVSNTTSVFAFDFGILYKTGFKSLNFGMAIRNFAKEVMYQKEGFQLPLTFKVGVSMNALDMTDADPTMHKFLIAVDAEHPRDFAEQVRLGGEYVFMDILSLRGGYVSGGDEYGMSYGVGLKKDFDGFGLSLDYARTPFGVFGAVNRFSFQFSL